MSRVTYIYNSDKILGHPSFTLWRKNDVITSLSTKCPSSHKNCIITDIN